MGAAIRKVICVLWWALVASACGGVATDVTSLPNEADRPGEPRFDSPPPVAEPPVIAGAQPIAADLSDLTRFPVFTDAGSVPELRVAPEGGAGTSRSSESRRFPLKSTAVRAELAGFAADVEVVQTFENVEPRTIEAVYVFPLPENAAVYRMEIKIGDRTIVGQVDERQRAKRTYEAAKRAGHVAALTEQERANVFTQSIANLEPRKSIEIKLKYLQRLSYDAGVHELVFPMVVGPRFVDGAPTGGAPRGTGTRADTTKVPDASRVTPPVAPLGERTGNDVSLDVTIPADLATSDLVSVGHAVTTKRGDGGTIHVTLDKRDRIPNRDFVLRYRVGAASPRATMLLPQNGRGYFALTVDPPDLDVGALVGSRELVFVVDVSGSMRGAPLALCKDAMRQALGRLGPRDTFNVISFAGRTEKLFPTSRKASARSIADAARFVDDMKAGGGTQMLDAVATALDPSVESGRHRYVFFMTDGFVSAEDQIIQGTRRFVSQIEGRGQRAKVFGFGVSSSPNRALIESLSREGKGLAVYATTHEDPSNAVNAFYRRIDASVLRNVNVDFGGASVAMQTPGVLPDLFASHPMIVQGRLDAPPEGTVRVRADSAKGPIEIPVTLVRVPSPDAGRQLGMLWARARVESLDADYAFGRKDVAPEITRLGKEFGILTRFTSFVAVDTSRTVANAGRDTVVQPVEVPEGVDGAAAGATPVTPSPLGNDADSARGGREIDEGAQSPPEPERGETDGDVLASGAPAPFERGKRGCNCTTDANGDATAGWLALVAVGVVILRRRRR